MSRLAYLMGALALLWLLMACDSGAPSPTPLPAATATAVMTPSAVPATATQQPAATLPPAAPSATPAAAPASPGVDTAAMAAYATITALAHDAAASATAAVQPTASPSPLPPPPTVPVGALGTYHLIVTARAEGYRVYRESGTLVLTAAKPGSNHSAELQFAHGVRIGHEHLDLSPGTTVGGLFLATSAALLPAGFRKTAPFAVAVVYNPATKYLSIAADPAHGIPGGWSTGPNNKARVPRPITAGTLEIDLGTPGQISGQFDLRSDLPGSPAATYSGGVQGTKR